MTFSQRAVDWAQRYKSTYFSPVGQWFASIGISANIMTGISLISGLLAVYFLFSNYWFFCMFGIIHLCADGLDGVIARATRTTWYGKYLDHIAADGVLTILIHAKIGWYLQDYYGYLVAGLYALTLLIYAASRLQAPLLFMRTITLIGAMLYIPSVHWTSNLLILNYLATGVAAAWTLALQLQWKIETR